MTEFQKNQIARIILKTRYGIATEEEKRIFEAWIQGGENRQALYDKIVSDESLKEYLNRKSDYDYSTDYNKLHSDIQLALKKRSKQRKIKQYALWSGSVAAVLLVGIFLVFELTKFPGEKKMIPVAQTSPTAASRDNVLLVLANGKTVGVKELQRDSLKLNSAVVIGRDNNLVYEAREEEEGELKMEEPEINKIITPTGGSYSLVLSDGTRVWLNSESELEFPVYFSSGKRLVRLTGEAYFEVTPDSSRPFIVETNGVRTRVLGTSFNIKAYPNEPEILTTLFTGKVSVAPLADTTRGVILSPGKQADWNIQAKQLNVRDAILDNILAWRTGKFIFNKENIEVVTRQIERWYGVKFLYESDEQKEFTFNGYFDKDESLESILNALTFMGGPKFKVDKEIIYVGDK